MNLSSNTDKFYEIKKKKKIIWYKALIDVLLIDLITARYLSGGLSAERRNIPRDY